MVVVTVDRFLGKRGDDLPGGGRLTAGLAAGDLATSGGGRLGVLGELTSGVGDLDDATLRNCNGPVGNFLRGDDFTAPVTAVAGTGGGLLPLTDVVGLPAFDRSFVDTDKRCLASGRWRLVEIRGSDDCRLSGSEDGLAARDRPFSGVLKPLPRNGLTRPLHVPVAAAAAVAFGCVCSAALAAGGSGNTTNAPRSLRRGLVLYASATVTNGGCDGGDGGGNCLLTRHGGSDDVCGWSSGRR